MGRIQATGTNSDLLAYKLKGTSGRVKWMHQFHRGANDLGSAIAVDSCRNVAVAGTTQTAKFFAETIKYGADVVPHSYTVHRGYVLGGTVDDVEYDDDSNLRIEQAQYTGNPYDRVRVYFDGTSPCTDPNQIRFELDYTFKELTAHSATVEIWFYNYSTGLWEGMAQVPAPASGDRVIVTVDSNPGRFVSGGPLKVYANWSAFGTTGNMIVDIDQVVWFVQR